jgi:hypothetical protein
MEEELSYSPQDIPDEEGPREENEESKNSLPQKRQKIKEDWSISTTTKHHKVVTERFIVVAHTDGDAI